MLEKDRNGNPISTFPPCYAFQMIFTALAPRLRRSVSRNVHNKFRALKQLWSSGQHNIKPTSDSIWALQELHLKSNLQSNFFCLETCKKNDLNHPRGRLSENMGDKDHPPRFSLLSSSRFHLLLIFYKVNPCFGVVCEMLVTHDKFSYVKASTIVRSTTIVQYRFQ